MKEAERASIKFYGRHLYDVVVSMASAGQNEGIDEVLQYYSKCKTASICTFLLL